MAITDPVGTNADWVEYCNAPNDGSNPGGGTDWAAQRAANGHPIPYGIKIWNIANEPWAAGEYGSSAASCNSFLAYVTSIIDAMLAIDPTLHITLPTTGNATNTTSWANALFNSTLVAQHKIYGVSQHYFITEKVSGGVIQTGVAAVQNNINALISYATTKGVKVLIGDYAHSIPTSPPTTHNDANENLAMQWQGANMEADFLIMISQKSNIDRVNFWAYGMPYGVWHPIRINSAGNYTLMPAADIYKKLVPAFLNKSLAVTTASPAASDGNVYAVRSGAFISTDASKLNFIAVNRDKLNTVPYLPTVPIGYTLSTARLITATSLQAESFSEDIVTADGTGNYAMPALSILILEYVNVPLSVKENISETNTMTLYPNPANDSVTLKSNTSKDLEIKIYNTLGQLVKTESLKENNPTMNVVSLKTGTYMVTIKSKELTINRTLLINR
ncbi:T9SS type A sorting domain-containing protein [Flavobacterium psychrotolerans]